MKKHRNIQNTSQTQNREKLIMQQKRYVRVCKDIDFANVTFHERGAAADKATPYFFTKKYGKPKSLPKCEKQNRKRLIGNKATVSAIASELSDLP